MLGNTVLQIFSFMLIALSLTFYIGWALKYNAWTDVGLFSFVSVVFIFGVLGVILTRLNEKESQ
ncbi:MAG: hypothetical protein ACP5SF_01260 [Thermoplasmata archaeon]